MRNFKGILLLVLFLVSQGCQSTISRDGSVSISAGSAPQEQNGDLGTLSTQQADLKKVLQQSQWYAIKTDIAAFYENSIYPAAYKRYTVTMRFGKREVVAYADCQKITARYSVEENRKLTFSTPEIGPDLEHATCIESQYADDAVIAFFENSFTLHKASEKRVVLTSDDFDVNVELLR